MIETTKGLALVQQKVANTNFSIPQIKAKLIAILHFASLNMFPALHSEQHSDI